MHPVWGLLEERGKRDIERGKSFDLPTVLAGLSSPSAHFSSFPLLPSPVFCMQEQVYECLEGLTKHSPRCISIGQSWGFFPLLTTLSIAVSSASLWIWRWRTWRRYCCLKTWHQGDQQPNLVSYLGVSDTLELGEKTIWDAGQGGSLCLRTGQGKDVLPGSGSNSSKTGSIWMRSNSGLELVWHLRVDKPLGSTALGNECEKCFVKCEFLYQCKEL